MDAVQGQWEPAIFHEPADRCDAARTAPIFLRDRVEPYRFRVDLEQAAQPYLARFIVPPLDPAAFLLYLIRAHAAIADQPDLVPGILGAQDFHYCDLSAMSA